MKNLITEAEVEDYFLTVLEQMGYEVVREDPDAYLWGDKSSLRSDYREVVVMDRLRKAVRWINPDVPESAREQATIWSAYNPLQTYREQIPNLFRFNEILIISDGNEARAGTITSDKERFLDYVDDIKLGKFNN